MTSATGGSAPLTPEQLASLPHDNQAILLVASIWTLGLIATVFLALRIYCRLFRVRVKRIGWDDAILIASWVCVIVESCLLTYMTTLGYGIHIWDVDINNLPAILLPNTIAGTFIAVASVWSKTSFGVTLLLLTDGWLKKFVWFCILSMNTAIFLSVLFPWIRCSPVQKTWDSSTPGTCMNLSVTVNYNIFSAAYSAAMYFMLALLPWKFLWGLQMKRSEKIGVGVAMSMGVFAGVTAVIKTAKLPQMLSDDFADGISLFIWGNAEVCSAIVAASIPMLRVLVRDANRKGSASRPGHLSAFYGIEAGMPGNNFGRFVTITSKPAPNSSHVELRKMGDDRSLRSDRSILGSSGHNERLQSTNGIVQVTNITVKYDEEAGGVHNVVEKE